MSIEAMKEALDVLDYYNSFATGKEKAFTYPVITALRQAIEQAEKPPIYVERATTDYEDGWEEGFKAGAQKEKESTPSNVDPRVPLNSNVNHIKINENRLCDIERRMTKIETQPTKESTLQEISDIEQWDTSDMAHRSGGLSVDMSTKPENIDTSAERVQETDKPIHELDAIERAYFSGKQQGIAESQAIKREWVSLSDEDKICAKYLQDAPDGIAAVIEYIEAKSKEFNT